MPRIHVMGASGSGTSTLGHHLARQLGIAHIDSDEIFWLPTDPPYRTPRPLAERRERLAERLPVEGDWVFSGSALNWAEPVEPFYDLIVFLWLDPAIRMARIRRREAERFGPRIQPGGDMFEASQAFLAWAEAYDRAGLEHRSRASHEAWLSRRQTPVLRLDSARPLRELLLDVLERLRRDFGRHFPIGKM
ncbi:AAA family ATPase [Rhizobium paknamense]|uniref:Adenylate kinase family enzyme n=1 Tax=Rhizobium paknamense TaxID=1206817 RepID=A0ABU0I7Y6_9HYPH|nr:AAA family ATPase [Rhizobium paknamense]MDQ0454337.1 adenylate kinase family enzyme [Rhizobium paknamense]